MRYTHVAESKGGSFLAFVPLSLDPFFFLPQSLQLKVFRRFVVMKQIIAILAITISIAALPVGATAPDLNDKILVMYQLSAAQEMQYNPASAALSAFWTTWDTINAAGLRMDYIFMASDNALYAENRTAGISFSGHDDAQLTVRCAYGAKGAYFYIAVEDVGAWTPYTAWQTDCADFYFDIVSKANMDPANFFNPTQWALTIDSKQFQLPFGGTTPAQINFRKYDQGSISIVDLLVDNNSATLDNMSWKLVGVDATHKTIEWFLPWTQWGLTGTPAATARFCFAPGYNDVDDGVESDVKSLRWINLCDPYCAPDMVNWGEIEAGPVFPHRDPLPPINAVNKFNRTLIHNAAAVSSELYSFRGDKIGGSVSKGTGLVVRRQVLSNGTRVPAQVSLGR
jgi:hypothetical protein